MHFCFFGIKRVHLRTLAITRPMIEDLNLTPARFDMLRIVLLHVDGIAQGTIRWLLGVSAATVSRMLKSLEQLGFVERKRNRNDGRCLIVRLTPRGRVAVRMALEMTVLNYEADRTAARGVTRNTRVETSSFEESYATIAEGRQGLTALGALLDNMRTAFDDKAPFRDPWRTAPFVPLVFTTLVDGRIRYGNEDPLATMTA